MDRYVGVEPSRIIGSGSYGVVYKVQDRITRETVALKTFIDETNKMPTEPAVLHDISTAIAANKGPAPQSNSKSSFGVPYYIIREVSVLKELRHENIVKLIDCVTDVNTGALSLVFEYLDTDLHRFIHDHDEILAPSLVRSLLRQCLRGIACCHESGILHRDLKPANLLLSRTGTLKVADFGLARVCASPGTQRRLTQEVVTLWYRAPEILLGSRQYGFAADLWSVGLIFVEMISKVPLFRTKRLAEIEVLLQIFQLAGTPTEATWPSVTKLPNWNRAFPRWRRRPVEPFLRQNLDERGLDLLYQLLTMDPARRITAKAAINHAYFL